MSKKTKESIFLGVRIAFIIWTVIIISYFVYKSTTLFLNLEILEVNYVKEQAGKTYFNFLGQEKIITEEMCINKVSFSYFGLVLLYSFITFLCFILNYYFYQFYVYCTCTKQILGEVYPDRFYYWLSYKDKNGNEYKNHVDYNQKTYRKIYNNYDGEAILHINTLNPKNYIIGSKAKFFEDKFFMPLVIDVSILILSIFLCFGFNPLFILSL